MKKRRVLAWGLVIAALLGLTIWLLLFLGDRIRTEPAEVRELAGTITGLEIPADLEPHLGVHLFGLRLAVFRGADERNSLVFADVPVVALNKSQAEWRARTQIDWSAHDPAPEISDATVMMRYGEQDLEVEVSEVRTKTGDYRAFLAEVPRGETRLKLFRVGPIGEVDAAHFQNLLDQLAAEAPR